MISDVPEHYVLNWKYFHATITQLVWLNYFETYFVKIGKDTKINV